MAEKQDEGTIYLGDGLYAAYDGVQIKLHAHDGFHETDTVYLETRVLEAFELWVKNLRERGVLPPSRP